MALSRKIITESISDEDLLALISAELNRRLEPATIGDNFDLLVSKIRQLPPGLRAMAATHRLDVSMAADDLGWHFHNFHHRGLGEETHSGLLELEAIEAAEIFKSAQTLVEPYWDNLVFANRVHQTGTEVFSEWYLESGLEEVMSPLNKRMWQVCERQGKFGLMQYWLDYARKYPNRVAEEA